VRSWKRRDLSGPVVAVALVVGLVAACGGSDPPTTSTSGGSNTSSGSGNPSGSNPSGSNPSGSNPSGSNPSGSTPSDGDLAWAPWGPADPGDPPPNQWYGNLERHDCNGLQSAVGDEPGRELWRALAAVCAAAVDGDQSQWAVAAATAKTLAANGGVSSGSCLERAARALLERALAWHERNPGRQPAVRFAAADSKTACAFRIDAVRVVDENGQPTGGPLEGPVTGSTLLALGGEGIDHPTQVRIGRQQAEIVTTVFVEGSVVVRTPQVDHLLTAEIRLRNRAGEVVAPVTFRYVATEQPTTETTR
jgi:hypothetical protein